MEIESQINITLFIILGVSAFLLLVGFIVLFVVFYQKKVLLQQNQMQLADIEYQHRLLEATVQVEEKERERIAKNIHDDVGMMLNVLRLNISGNTSLLSTEEDPSGKETVQLLDDVIQRVRSIAKELVPPTLLKLGYTKAMKELCRHINLSGKVQVDITENNPAEERLEAYTELQLYRLSQELINNLLKHSNANTIHIIIHFNEESTFIRINHNGKGIDDVQVHELSKEDKGVGLKSIQSRAQLINATVHYVNEPGNQPYISVCINNGKEKN